MNINFKYTWNGKDVSEEEYSSNLGKVFNIDRAELISEQGVSASEIITQIQNF